MSFTNLLFFMLIGNPRWPLSTRTKNSKFVEDHPRNIPAKFGSNWPSGFGEEAWNVKSLQMTDDRRRTPTTWTIETKLPRNDHWKVLYKFCVCYADQKSKMAATAGHRLTLDPMGKCSNAFPSDGNSSPGPKIHLHLWSRWTKKDKQQSTKHIQTVL
jgi:hypothetical protein